MKLNKTVFFKILLLFGFASFYLVCILTGTIKQYIHPRIIPFIVFASLIMVSIAILFIGELFRKSDRKDDFFSLFIFLIPLIITFVFPAKTYITNIGTMRDIEISTGQNNHKEIEENSQYVEQQEINTEIVEDDYSQNQNSSLEKATLMQEGVIIMDGNNFYHCLDEIYSNINEYEGTPIEVEGFVFKDDTFGKNQFVPARLLMVCCAADTVPIGLLCEYDNTESLNENVWIKVEGTIMQDNFDGEVVPIIKATHIETAERPPIEYVYPY